MAPAAAVAAAGAQIRRQMEKVTVMRRPTIHPPTRVMSVVVESHLRLRFGIVWST